MGRDAPHILIVAGEASGDLHGAHLAEALRELSPSVTIAAMGGKALAAHGATMLADAARLAVVGIFEVLSHLGDIRAAMASLTRHLRDRRPDLVVLIDYPDFNLLLARRAKKLGIPVLYYISPQVWAWRSGRVKTIRRLVNRMAVILPFEQEFYARHGMMVDFVGHPLLDSVRTTLSREEFCRRHGLPAANRLIGLLPGSRKKELAAMLPLFLAAAERLAAAHPDLTFLIPLAPTLSRADLDQCGLSGTSLDVRVVEEDRYELMAACRAVMAASGTVTLELAILGVPMVVAYRVSGLTYALGRRLIKVAYASLVNLVAGERVVDELLQHDATPEKIGSAVGRLLEDAPYRQAMIGQLHQVRERLGEAGASRRTAELALAMIPRP
ncbi:MAG: lipid-A-disaccharide synthase [Thermodesulfobacteriota bacterium]